MALVSDLEGTLTEGATWRACGEYVKAKRGKFAYSLFFFLHVPGIPLVRVGLLDEQDFKTKWLVDLLTYLRGLNAEEVTAMAEWVVETEMWPKRRSDVLAELEAHQRAGQRVIIASGTFQPIAEAFARRIGVTEVIASPLEVDSNGRLTGKFVGALSVRGEKIANLKRALNGDPISAAYGDTASDIPMLEQAEQAVAVYPDPVLRKKAQKCGWRILESQQIAQQISQQSAGS